jgi:hypothetical protein
MPSASPKRVPVLIRPALLTDGRRGPLAMEGRRFNPSINDGHRLSRVFARSRRRGSANASTEFGGDVDPDDEVSLDRSILSSSCGRPCRLVKRRSRADPRLPPPAASIPLSLLSSSMMTCSKSRGRKLGSRRASLTWSRPLRSREFCRPAACRTSRDGSPSFRGADRGRCR